jgi:hypothetical protein
MVRNPLAVWAGLNVPHAPALPQVTVQSTPLFVPSLVTVAETLVMPPTARLTGGSIEKPTLIGKTVTMVTMALLDTVGSAVEVAIIITVFSLGMLAGGV